MQSRQRCAAPFALGARCGSYDRRRAARIVRRRPPTPMSARQQKSSAAHGRGAQPLRIVERLHANVNPLDAVCPGWIESSDASPGDRRRLPRSCRPMTARRCRRLPHCTLRRHCSLRCPCRRRRPYRSGSHLVSSSVRVGIPRELNTDQRAAFLSASISNAGDDMRATMAGRCGAFCTSRRTQHSRWIRRSWT